MEKTFPLDHIPRDVADIARKLREAGHEAWYVGGAVRDELLNLPRREIIADIATSARPEQVRTIFRRTIPIGIEHGTVVVLDSGGGAHEVTTFRRDVKTDGRHAVVEFGVSLDEDLARRDFTINAIAAHPASGELHDPFGGMADLERRVLRAVGDPATRFREDWLRVLRALRFAAILGFTIDAPTWDALAAAVQEGSLEHLSRERVRDEWMKSLDRAPATRVLDLWRRSGALAAVWPELAELPPQEDAALDRVVPREPVLVTAAALARADVAPNPAEAAVRRLRFSNRDMTRVRGVVEGLRELLPDANDGKALRRWLSRHGEFALDIASCVPDGAVLREAVGRALGSGVPLGIGDLAVTGEDLMAAGVPKGPAVGQALRKLLDAVLDDPALNNREHLLSLVARGTE